jgi:hypothetical protein
MACFATLCPDTQESAKKAYAELLAYMYDDVINTLATIIRSQSFRYTRKRKHVIA